MLISCKYIIIGIQHVYEIKIKEHKVSNVEIIFITCTIQASYSCNCMLLCIYSYHPDLLHAEHTQTLTLIVKDGAE